MTRQSADDTGRTDTLTTIIPQDAAAGIYEVALGLTPSDLVLLAAPVVVEVWLILSFFSPARWQVWLLVGTVGAGIGILHRAPAHLSPREVVVRSVGGLWARARMPLVGRDALAVPGVVEVHDDVDAVERTDGAQVALVEVAPSNASRAGAGEREERAARVAAQLDAKLSKNGVPAKVVVRRRDPSLAPQVGDLQDVAADGCDHSRGERALAVDAANTAYVSTARSGVCDRSVFVATWVSPGEVDASAALSGTRFATVSPAMRDEQTDLLDRRARLVEETAATVADARRLDADGMVAALREYWRGLEDGADHSATTHDGAPVGLSSTDGGSGETIADGGADSGTRGANPGGDGDKSGSRGVLARLRGASLARTAWAPGTVDAHHRHADVGDLHTTTLWVTGWPKVPAPGFFAPVLEADDVECDLAVFVGRAGRERKMRELGARMDKAGDEGERSASAGDAAGTDDAARVEGDLAALRDHLRDAGVHASEVSAYITLRARDTDTLATHRTALEEAATGSGVTVRTAAGATRQVAGLRSTSPVGGDRLFTAMRGTLDKFRERHGFLVDLPELRTGARTRTDMPPGAVGALLPFSGGVRQDPDGVLYGMARSTSDGDHGLLQVARDRLSSPHRFFVGRSGSGKTFRATVNLAHELLRNPERRAAVLDIAGSFDGVVELFDDEKVVLGETPINPFAVSDGTDLDSQATLLTSMFQVYLRHNADAGVAEAVRATLSDAVREAFRRAGVETGSDGLVVSFDRQPVTADLHDALEDMHDNPDDHTVRGTETETDELREHAGMLLSRLRPFASGGAYDFLAPEAGEGANLDARVVLYDMGDYVTAGGAEKGMLTMLVLSRALEAAASTDAKVTVTVDEAHDLFGDVGQAGLLESAVRAGRNAGLCFDFLSQADEDFDESTARIIAKQCSVSVWGDLGEIDPETPERFGWSPAQAKTINGGLATGDNAATDYAEAMVDVEGDRYLTRLRVGPVAKAVAEYRAGDGVEWADHLEAAIQAAADRERETHPSGDLGGPTDVEARAGGAAGEVGR